MSKNQLSSSNLESFCEGIALMLSVGVQMDEAAYLLADNAEDKKLREISRQVYDALIGGARLARAMESTGAFPLYAIEMVAAGEKTGKIQETLESLASYYDEEHRLSMKIRQSITYPAIILCVMSVVLAFVVTAILPVFLGVYQDMAGGLASSSLGAVQAGIAVGWVALIITLVCTAVVLFASILGSSAAGRKTLMSIMRFIPGASSVFAKFALSRFASTLSVYIASGDNVDDAMRHSISTIDDAKLRDKVERAQAAMMDKQRALGLVQALDEYEIIDPMHVRMLTFGMKTGRLDEVLGGLSEDVFEDGVSGLDSIIDKFEPILAGFVTVAVGLTLVAVMLPLVGMIGSIS